MSRQGIAPRQRLRHPRRQHRRRNTARILNNAKADGSKLCFKLDKSGHGGGEEDMADSLPSLVLMGFSAGF
jgi:hypothetical protein